MASEIVSLDKIDEGAENAPDMVRLAELLPQRQNLADVASEGRKADGQRKVVDDEILGLMLQNEMSGVKLGDIVLVESQNKGRGGWDSAWLRQNLTPEQLEKAWKDGTPRMGVRVGKAE